MRVIHIIFSSLLSIGSTQTAGAGSDALKNALGALTPAQIQAILGAVGSNADVHVGGTNEEAKPPLSNPISSPDIGVGSPAISVQPAVPQQPPQPAISLQPVVPQQSVQPVLPVEGAQTVAAPTEPNGLTPTQAELAADTNLLTPVESPERLEDEEIPEMLGAAAPSENIDPAEDTPLQPVVPNIIITTPQPTTTTTNATTTSPPAAAEPVAAAAGDSAPLDLAALFAKMSPEDRQALLAQAAQPSGVSTEVLAGQVNAAQDALAATPAESVPVEPIEPLNPIDPVVSVAPAATATNTESDITTSFGSRADSTEITTDAITEPAAPVDIIPEQTPSDTVAALDTSEPFDLATNAHFDLADVETVSEPEIDTGVIQTDVASPEETTTTELDTASEDGLQTWQFDDKEYEDDDEYDNYEEDYDEDYDEDYEEEYDEDEYEDYTTEQPGSFGEDYSQLLDTNDGEFNFASDAQDVDPEELGALERNYRLNEELREIDEIEEEFEDNLGEDKANWNFAFFLIVFVIVVTGVYYVVNLIRTKFCPKNVSFKEYLSKRWRYWDGDESQSYSLLPGQDADIKTSVSSEAKEEWNNDDW